ncbi:MAG TPA: hypothetical protein EYP53_00490 [Candidatus Latescibacteria bacterium]|nr:hypothetical protein [Candidatus Latescibacterota bacterium]
MITSQIHDLKTGSYRYLPIIVAVFILSPLFTASGDYLAGTLVDESSGLTGPRPISGTPLLRQKASELVKLYGVPSGPPPVSKPVAYGKGDTLTFWAHDFSTDRYYQTTAICLAVGDHSYIFLEEGQEERVNQEAGEELLEAFERSTARDANRGIYDIIADVFGQPSDDVDGDPRIFIMILDIRDNFKGSRDTFYAGYFDRRNQFDPEQVPHSNHREMLYIDCNPLDFKHKIDKVKGVLAHEFQHLVHFTRDPDEQEWINEGCSGYAEYITGYLSLPFGMNFLRAPDNSLTGWRGVRADYEKTFLFIAYLAEHYGGEAMIKQLVKEQGNGISGVEGALAHQGEDATFADVFSNWVIANYLDGEGIYGYAGLDLPRKASATEWKQLPADTVDQVQPWAADYVEFTSGSNIKIRFQGSPPGQYLVQLVSKSGSVPQVSNFPLDLTNAGDLTISDYDTLTLVVARTFSRVGNYSYWAEESTSVEPAQEEVLGGDVPLASRLFQNIPNPFNSGTIIPFSIGGMESRVISLGFGNVQSPYLHPRVTLEVFNLSGQRIRVLLDGDVRPGRYAVGWDGKDQAGRDVSSGVYIYRLKVNGSVRTKRMLLLR